MKNTTWEALLGKILWKHMRPIHDGATNDCISNLVEELERERKEAIEGVFTFLENEDWGGDDCSQSCRDNLENSKREYLKSLPK